jgi:hypothetical protein
MSAQTETVITANQSPQDDNTPLKGIQEPVPSQPKHFIKKGNLTTSFENYSDEDSEKSIKAKVRQIRKER